MGDRVPNLLTFLAHCNNMLCLGTHGYFDDDDYDDDDDDDNDNNNNNNNNNNFYSNSS